MNIVDFYQVVLEKTLENLLDSKEIKQVNPKGNQSWIFLGRTDAEAEAPIFWPPDVKSQLTGKDPDARKDQRQKEKEAKEDKMVEWHHQLNVHEFEKTLGDSEGQVSLACCSPKGSQRVRHDWVTEQQQQSKTIIRPNLHLLTNETESLDLFKEIKTQHKFVKHFSNYI